VHVYKGLQDRNLLEDEESFYELRFPKYRQLKYIKKYLEELPAYVPVDFGDVTERYDISPPVEVPWKNKKKANNGKRIESQSATLAAKKSKKSKLK
jgi:hypothetical protein